MKALNGVILIGGRSRRMGTDKSMLTMNGNPQYLHLSGLLADQVDEVILSGRQEQRKYIDNKFRFLVDSQYDQGPLYAIAEVLKQTKRSALVTACDMPYIDKAAIKNLINHRDIGKKATVYYDRSSFHLQPLFGIWEYHTLPLIVEFLDKGERSAIDFLDSVNISLINYQDDKIFTNVNTKDDLEGFQLSSK